MSSNIIAVELDLENGGGDSWLAFVRANYDVRSWHAYDKLPVGREYWFFESPPGGMQAATLARGVRVIDSGYAFTSTGPIIHGKPCKWWADCDMDETPLAPAPEWLVRLPPVRTRASARGNGAAPNFHPKEDIAMATYAAKNSARINFSDISVIDVAHVLLGDEDRAKSTANEKHFSGFQGLYVNIQKNLWYSHGNEIGGDALGLVKFVESCDVNTGIAWLQSNGFLTAPPRPHQASTGPQESATTRLVATYAYKDQDGADCYFVNRYEPKGFSQWRMIDGERVNGVTGGMYERRGIAWCKVSNGSPRRPGVREFPAETPLPYRLPELLQSGDAPVLIPGGEKDVDNLRALGFTATCNHGGEGKWYPELSPRFRGRRVFILCDNDRGGEKHQETIGAALTGVAGEIHVVRFPELPDRGDVSDFIALRMGAGADSSAIRNELALRFREAPEWAPSPEDHSSNSSFVGSEPEWPVLSDEAYYGLVGEVVNTIKPETEADPAAVLIQLLACAGSMMGNSHHYLVESDRHHPNLFVNIVGDTSKSRKGTSYGRVRAVCAVADKEWVTTRTKGGLSSGEGFINEVRDPVNKWNAKDQTWEIVDPGVTDKRLLIIEPEFAAALAVMERHGNTLSPQIRKAWDGERLATMTRNSPLVATGAHISIVSHITEPELRARLTRTEAANGFANRFLFVLATRGQLLPFGGNLDEEDILALGTQLKEAIDKLPALPERIRMTEAAAREWQKVYPELTAAKYGLLGAVTARAEAQTIRISLIYALLDGSPKIDVPHLKAGLAVWEYCESSAAHIFGETIGDPVAEELLGALKVAGESGLSRTEAHAILGRNKSAEQIAVALDYLVSRGLAVKTVRSTGPKPVVVWVISLRATKNEFDE